MNLIRTGLLNSIAVGVRIITLMGLNKLLAIYIGPSGYAVIGQFQNFVSMLTTLSSGAFNTGVTKYTAEYFDNEAQQVTVWKTAGTIALIGSIGIGLMVAVLNGPLALRILQDSALGSIFVFLGAGLVLFTLNGLLFSILNGKKEINRLVAVNIAGSLVSLAVTGGLAVFYGLYGALLALAINQSVIFCITLAICQRTKWFDLHNLVGGLNKKVLRGLGKYTMMALTTAICSPGSQIIVRNHLGDRFGWTAAGHWEALMRISGLYLMIVTTPLAIYYLPRLSEIRENKELWREIINGYRIILPVAVCGAAAIYLLRDWIVLSLFTAAFLPMRDLFSWQLMGDVMKIGSWLFGYVLLGRAMVKTFIIGEIVFSVSWIGLVFLLTGWYGVQGAQIGYFWSYCFYWAIIGAAVFNKIR